MDYRRMAIEKESPEEIGYGNIRYNLAESSVKDLLFGELSLDLRDLKLEYIAHRGHEGLRKIIAAEAPGLLPEQVLLTHGAAGAIFIINTSILSPADHLLVVRPNYATNIEVPKTIGCSISYLDLNMDNDWRLDIDSVAGAIRPNTKMISITSPHNPTGMVMTEEELTGLQRLAEEKNSWLLVDETYRDACFPTPYPWLAARSANIISISSLSKAYGLPGLRLGWIIAKNTALMEQFLAAKEMICISNSAIDEEIAFRVYREKEKWLRKIQAASRENFECLGRWLNREKRLQGLLPQGGVVCFPRLAEGMDTDAFYRKLRDDYGTMVGPGHWFGMPDRYMRIGFGWLDKKDFEKGLENISRAIDYCGG